MFSSPLSRPVLAGLALLLSGAASAESLIKLHHRIYTPDTPTVWTERGHLSDREFAPSPGFSQDLRAFAEAASVISVNEDTAFYQVALETGGANPLTWDISSVKLCHLRDITTEHIIIHSSTDSHAHGLDFFVEPIPATGACAKHALSPGPIAWFAPLEGINLNRTITFALASPPTEPILRLPPPISAEGEAIVPPPEKSLLEKYWMYGVGVVLLLLLTTSDPDDGKAPPAK